MPDHDLEELIANLKSTDEKLCLESIERLGQSEDERALEPLIEAAVQTSNYTVRYQAEDALEQLSQVPHIADLLISKLVEDISIERIELIARLVYRTADPHVAELLTTISRKHTKSDRLREYAIWATIRCQRFRAEEYWDGEKVKVLVTDDDSAVRDLLNLLLKRQEFSVLTAEDGLDGYEFAKICQPDVLILDLMMPVMDGWQVCRAIRSDETTQKIPVIILSALNDPSMIASVLDAGADDYLTKPTPSRVLIAHVERAVRQSRLGIYDRTDRNDKQEGRDSFTLEEQ